MSEGKEIIRFDADDPEQLQEIVQSPALLDKMGNANLAPAKALIDVISKGRADPEEIVEVLTDLQKIAEELAKVEDAVRAQYGEMGVFIFVWGSRYHYMKNPDVMQFFPFVDRAYNTYKEDNQISDLPAEKIEWEVYVEIIKSAASEAQKVQNEAAIAGAEIILEDADMGEPQNGFTELQEIFKRESPLMVRKTIGYMNDTLNKKMVIPANWTQSTSRKKEMRFEQARRDGKKSIPVYVSMTYMGDKNLVREYDYFDDAAVDAIAKIYRDNSTGKHSRVGMTVAEIWRTMNGMAGKPEFSNRNPSPKQAKRIEENIDYYRYVNCFIDVSAMITAGGFIKEMDDRVVKGGIEDYFYAAKKGIIETEKGKRIAGYIFFEEPVVYSYNTMLRRAINYDYELLDTNDTTGNEGYTVEFRMYLIEQITSMHNGYRKKTKILYRTLYNETGIPEPQARFDRGKYKTENTYRTAIRKEKQKDRQKIRELLESWKRKKWIIDFEETKPGREYDGVNIILNPKNINREHEEEKQITKKKL